MPTSSYLSRIQLDQLARLGAQARLHELQAEVATLKRLIGGTTAGNTKGNTALGPRRRRRGKISAAGRAAIAAAQKARWAKIKSGAPRKRRSMSAAQRAAVGRRMKAYWAARRRAKAKAA